MINVLGRKQAVLLAFVILMAVHPLMAGCDEAVFDMPATMGENPSFDAVGTQLQNVKVLRASFKQKKKIKVLRRPLRSSGSFLISAEMGLYWKSVSPFETIFIITPKALYQKSENAEPITIQAQERPIIYGFTRVFLSLFSGDTQKLDQEFDLFFSGTPDNWTIGLIPKSKIMGKLIDRVLVCGADTIRSIDFRESSGDRTQIIFDEISTDPPHLTEEELACFDF